MFNVWTKQMKPFTNLAFCLTLVLGIAVGAVDGQTVAPAAQNRNQVAARHDARPANVHSNVVVARNFSPGPANFHARMGNPYVVRTIGQPAMNLRRSYAPFVRRLNPTLAAINARRIARAESPRRSITPYNSTLLAADARPSVTTHGAQPPAEGPDKRPPTQDVARTHDHNRDNHRRYADALRAHWHEWHDRNWWTQHCTTIVFVPTGYYFLDGSYWYPAWGYDPLNNYYDNDGPVYTYGNLLPDEVIANVQSALQGAGYYNGSITGSLNVETRAAIANFQRDQGLDITGAIDESTIDSLGLTTQSGD